MRLECAKPLFMYFLWSAISQLNSFCGSIKAKNKERKIASQNQETTTNKVLKHIHTQSFFVKFTIRMLWYSTTFIWTWIYFYMEKIHIFNFNSFLDISLI